MLCFCFVSCFSLSDIYLNMVSSSLGIFIGFKLFRIQKQLLFLKQTNNLIFFYWCPDYNVFLVYSSKFLSAYLINSVSLMADSLVAFLPCSSGISLGIHLYFKNSVSIPFLLSWKTRYVFFSSSFIFAGLKGQQETYILTIYLQGTILDNVYLFGQFGLLAIVCSHKDKIFCKDT